METGANWSRESLAAIVEGNSEGILIASLADRQIVYANPAVCQMFGYSHEEMLTLSVNDLHPPDQMAEIAIIFESMGRGDQRPGEAIPCLRKDGTIFMARISASPMVLDGIPCNVGFFSDNTEREETLKDLRQAKRDWESIFQGIPHPTLILDAEHRVIAGNRRLEQILNKSFPEYRHLKCWQIFHGGQARCPPHGCPFERMLESKAIESAEMEIEAFGGVYIISCTPIFNAAGRVDKVVHIGTDITEIKRAEGAIRMSEARYRAIVENTNDALFIHDGEGHIFDVNENACRMLGYSREELVGASLSMVDSEEDTEKLAMRTRRLCEAGSLVFEVTHIRKDGTPLAVQISAKLVSKEGKGIIQGFARDVTAMKKMEESLALSQKLESIGVLAGGIAHDFNNLLSGIYGYMDLARSCSGDPEVSHYLDSSLGTLDRARNLTRQLLTFSKGGSPIRKTDRLTRTLHETVPFALSGSNVSYLFDVPKDLWPCDFDASQMAQVIENLTINAQQAMPLGGTVTVRAANLNLEDGFSPELPKGRYVMVTIEDTGTGIPEEIRARIFDPFFTTKQKGSGLGLATAYSIVKRHEGTITVESRPTKGSAFRIFLPASSAPIAPLLEESTPVAVMTGRVLVMDDEPVVLDVLREMLKRLGYFVVGAKDGHRALQLYEQESLAGRPFDAIVLDLTIPGGIGGVEVVARIRETNADIPVFVASGYSEDPVLADPSHYGFTASLRKPFKKAELSQMLTVHLMPRAKVTPHGSSQGQ